MNGVFGGEEELRLLAKSLFGTDKTSMTAFMANQLKEYLPEKEFLILACGLPSNLNSKYPLERMGDFEEGRINIFLKIDK